VRNTYRGKEGGRQGGRKRRGERGRGDKQGKRGRERVCVRA